MAKAWRSVWQVACLATPARWTASLTARWGKTHCRRHSGRGSRVRARERVRELDAAPAGGEIRLVHGGRAPELVAQRGLESARERCGSVLAAFAVAHDQFATADVEDAEAQALREAQACAVQERRDEPRPGVGAVELLEESRDLLPTQHDGQALGLLRADQILQLADLAVQHEAVEDRGDRLGLLRRADLIHDGEMHDEGVDLCLRHLGRVTQAVEADVTPHSLAVGLLGAASHLGPTSPIPSRLGARIWVARGLQNGLRGCLGGLGTHKIPANQRWTAAGSNR